MEFVKMQFQVKSKSLWQQFIKKSEIYKGRILSHLDLLLKIRHKERKVWCLLIAFLRNKKIVYVWIQMKS